jgi:excisionase family DNA binding protein
VSARPYTPETLAAEWQCSAKHIRNLVNSGALRGFRLGGKLIRIPVEAVEQYLCQHTVSAGSMAASSSASSTLTEAARTVTVLDPRTRAELNARRQESSRR